MPIDMRQPTNPTTDASWQNPQRSGALREWWDATNKVKRYKEGSNPTSETDGYMYAGAE
jgi:hypothetical protein